MGKMIRNILPALGIIAAMSPALFMGQGCANTTQSPSGGDKDSIPPFLLWADPMPGAVNVPAQGTKLYFGFDEYVKIKDPKALVLSPPQKKSPKTKIHKRGFFVTFEQDLDSNTTYSLNFLNAVADNNEGNVFPNFTYVFSTGESIDSMYICGEVLDCNDLKPVKGATVMLYTDLSDSAVLKHRPDAAAKTDDWGFFSIPFIKDTSYRLYAITDENNDYIYQSETEKVAFHDTVIIPDKVFNDTIPELRAYDMKDTLGCKERVPEYTLLLFKENVDKQVIVNTVRVSDRTSYITFMSHNAWIDSLWIKGYRPEQIITQFNLPQDSLEIWVNDRRLPPDTLNLYVSYRKTDSLGKKSPFTEKVPLFMEGGSKKKGYVSKKDLKKEDTTCVFTLTVNPETFEKDGFNIEFKEPIIYEHFDSVKLIITNPKQVQTQGKFNVERDSMNIRKYIIRIDDKILPGYEYELVVPNQCFRGLNGFYSDSTRAKVHLPTDDKLSTVTISARNVHGKTIVELLPFTGQQAIRTFIINEDQDLVCKYIKAGDYKIRITEDRNGNSMVDTGNLLEHLQSEKVRFYKEDDKTMISIPEMAEMTQIIDIQELLED